MIIGLQVPILPLSPSVDSVDRWIDFVPTKNPYDPRWMLAGRVSPVDPDVFETGFFDRGSFDEIMAGWAKTVVCGRARLGGVPCGVIAVETRTVELEIPADPAAQHSEARLTNQAGQVIYSCSTC